MIDAYKQSPTTDYSLTTYCVSNPGILAQTSEERGTDTKNNSRESQAEAIKQDLVFLTPPPSYVIASELLLTAGESRPSPGTRMTSERQTPGLNEA